MQNVNVVCIQPFLDSNWKPQARVLPLDSISWAESWGQLRGPALAGPGRPLRRLLSETEAYFLISAVPHRGCKGPPMLPSGSAPPPPLSLSNYTGGNEVVFESMLRCTRFHLVHLHAPSGCSVPSALALWRCMNGKKKKKKIWLVVLGGPWNCPSVLPQETPGGRLGAHLVAFWIVSH